MLVDLTANAHFVDINSKGELKLELHTYQKDARISFKKVADFSNGNVDDFFAGNIIDFFDTKILVVLTANTQRVEIYQKGALELHTHQENAWISLKEVNNFFDSRKTLVDMTANTHLTSWKCIQRAH